MTAVEYAVEKLEKFIPSGNQLAIEAILEQAKAMEKEQIIDALMTSEIELLSWGISAEKYYNETFKS